MKIKFIILTFFFIIILATQNTAFSEEKISTLITVDPLRHGDVRGDLIIIAGKLMTDDEKPVTKKVVKIIDKNRGQVLGSSITDFDGIFKFVWDVGNTSLEHSIYDVYDIYAEFPGDDVFDISTSTSQIVRPYTWRPHVTVSIDKSSYVNGEPIRINGMVYKKLGNFVPIVTIYDPTTSRIMIHQLSDIKSNLRYNDEIKAGGPLWKFDGTYILEISYGPNRKAFTTFEYYEESFHESNTSEQIVPQIKIPSWIKNIAGFWCNENIDDSSFINTVTYLIQNKIIILPPTNVEFNPSKELPVWIKSNACWWSRDIISGDSFSLSLQHMIKNGVINP